MSVIKNRTVIGILCIVLSLVICFVVTPLFNKSISKKTEIVRVVKPIKIGDEITKDNGKNGWRSALITCRRMWCGRWKRLPGKICLCSDGTRRLYHPSKIAR